MLQGLIAGALVGVPIIALYVAFFIAAFHSMHTHSGFIANTVFPQVIFLGMLLIAFLALFVMTGMIHTALKQIQGKTIRPGDIFAGRRYVLKTFILVVLVQLVGQVAGIPAVLAGVLLIPHGHIWLVLGIIVVALFFCCCMIALTIGYTLMFIAFPLIVAQRVTIRRAITLSWRALFANFWLFFLFSLIANFLAQCGAMACYIGLVATLPFAAIAQAVAYTHTFPSSLPDDEGI